MEGLGSPCLGHDCQRCWDVSNGPNLFSTLIDYAHSPPPCIRRVPTREGESDQTVSFFHFYPEKVLEPWEHGSGETES